MKELKHAFEDQNIHELNFILQHCRNEYALDKNVLYSHLASLTEVLLARTKAAFDLVFHAGPPGPPVNLIDLVWAGSELKFTIHQGHGFVSQRGGQIGAKI